MNFIRVLIKISIFLSFTSLTVGQAFSQELLPNQDDAFIASLGAKLKLNITSIADSPVPGLKQIFTNRGLFYVSDNGEYFLQARVYGMKNGVEDLTEKALISTRLKGIDKFKDSMIEFKAKDEKYVISVFTDTTCGYCRKLHNDVPQLNDLGITVRYLAWPRAGLRSVVYRDTVSIWCADDPQQALTDAKSDVPIEDVQCENAVADQYRFGQQIGVSGTPQVILPDGTIVPGYKPVRALFEAIRQAS